MNLPNAISLFRIALVPFFARAYGEGDIALSIGILLLCALSDVLDGAAARRLGQVTDLGKMLDPVADKLIQAVMMLCAADRTPQLWLLLALHVLRECSLAVLGLYVRFVTGRVYGAKWYGKLCTAAIYALMLTLLLYPELPMQITDAAVMCCALLMGFCLVMYCISFARILRRFQAGGAEKQTDS